MSTGYSSKAMVCPFFRWDKRLEVHCEGGVAAFPDKDARMDYVNRYCGSMDGWPCCTLAELLTQYYERTDDNGAQCGQNQASGT